MPEEVSRKHGSRIRRLARPDVSQARRPATNVSQGVSQGQRSRDRRFARTGVPTSLFSSYFSSMLVRLSTLWFGFCLLWSFNLSFDQLPEEVSRKHGSRNRRLARTDVCNDARPDVSQQTSRKDRRTYFLLRSTGKHRGLATDVSQRQASLLLFRLFIFSEPFVWLLYLPVSFTLSFCKLTEEHSRKQRGLATDVSQGQTSTDVSQGQTSRNRRLARTGMPTSLFSSYFSSVLVHLPSVWFGYCTSFCPLTFLSKLSLRKCLASTALASDDSQGQTSAMTQGQTSRHRRLARTGVPTFFCSYACSSS